MVILILRNLLILLTGAAIGYTFADIDLAPPLPVAHRSAWTHGPMIPLTIFIWSPGGLWPYFISAFLLANALHLLRDMFPKKWAGGALIKLHPIRGAMGPALSFVWLAIGVMGSGWLWFTHYSVYLIFWR